MIIFVSNNLQACEETLIYIYFCLKFPSSTFQSDADVLIKTLIHFN